MNCPPCLIVTLVVVLWEDAKSGWRSRFTGRRTWSNLVNAASGCELTKHAPRARRYCRLAAGGCFVNSHAERASTRLERQKEGQRVHPIRIIMKGRLLRLAEGKYRQIDVQKVRRSDG